MYYARTTEQGSVLKTVSIRLLYTISLNHFVNDGSTFLIASLFPAMVIAFGFSTYEIGILVALGYLVNVIFQPLTGRASQRFQPAILLSVGIATMAVSMGLFAVSSTYPMMILAVIVMRVGSSFFHPVGAATISGNYSGSRLDTSMGIESAFGNLGIVFAFMLSAPMYLRFGWTGPFTIYALLQVFTVIFTMTTMGRTRMATNLNHSIKIDDDETPTPDSMYRLKANAHKNRAYLLYIPMFFIITAFISGGSNSMFGNFGNLLLYHNGFDISISNDLIALWVLCAFFGAMTTGRLTKAMSRMRLLSVSYLISGISALGFAFLSDGVLIAALMLAANGFFLAITYPATYSELADVFSKEGNGGSAFGMLFSSQIIGASSFGFLSGYFSSAFGLASIFELASVLLFLCVAIVFIWDMRYRHSSQMGLMK